MQTDKVTVITGEPRSGTSLMMQTLSLLGVPVVGKSLLNQPKRLLKESHRDSLNPRGFFEIPGIVMRGLNINNAPDYYGKAIKIINSGLATTPPDALGTVILCLRSPKNIVTSQKGLKGNVQVRKKGNWQYAQAFQKTSPNLYIQRMGKLLLYLSNNPSINIFPVEFTDMLKTPSVIIDSLISQLGITVESVNRQAAIDNVGLGKPNSKADTNTVWESNSGTLATSIYQCLGNSTYPDTVKSDITKFYQDKQDEYGISWITEEFGLFLSVTPSLYNSLKNNYKLIQNLVEKNTNREMYDCRKCNYYVRSGADDSFSTIYGKIVRKKVTCLRDSQEVSIEKCYNCWKNERLNQIGA